MSIFFDLKKVPQKRRKNILNETMPFERPYFSCVILSNNNENKAHPSFYGRPYQPIDSNRSKQKYGNKWMI